MVGSNYAWLKIIGVASAIVAAYLLHESFGRKLTSDDYLRWVWSALGVVGVVLLISLNDAGFLNEALRFFSLSNFI